MGKTVPERKTLGGLTTFDRAEREEIPGQGRQPFERPHSRGDVELRGKRELPAFTAELVEPLA